MRSVTLVHYRTNDLADAMTNAPVHGGLTSEGDAIVQEMNRLGMVIDLSHMAEAGAFRALELSTRPVMFTHTHISSAHSYHFAGTCQGGSGSWRYHRGLASGH